MIDYRKCEKKSVFGGKYLFDIIDEKDERMMKAWKDFEEEKYGCILWDERFRLGMHVGRLKDMLE